VLVDEGKLQGDTTLIKKYKWGFVLANFERPILLGSDSFTFFYVDHVFYSR